MVFTFTFPLGAIANYGDSYTLRDLKDMMRKLTKRKFEFRKNAVDIACWTPIAHIVRRSRRLRIEEAAETNRMQRKTAALCRNLAEKYSELTKPCW